MPWFTIHSKADGAFLRGSENPYDSNGVEGDLGYVGKDARFRNFTHTEENAIHTEIADKPSDDHYWDDNISKWVEDTQKISEKREAIAREAFEKSEKDSKWYASSEYAAL